MWQWLRLFDKDHECVVLPLGGGTLIRDGVEQELSELTRLSEKIAVIIDSEKAGPTDPLAPQREAFVRACRDLNFNVHVMDRRSIENYLPERAIQSVKGPKYRGLTPYERREDANPTWAKEENWRIARAMTKDEIMATDVGPFLDGL
jgi:hypothetical protein